MMASLHIVHGDKVYDKRNLEKAARRKGKIKSWVVPKNAQRGDDVVVNVGAQGFFATARIAAKPVPRTNWKNRYGSGLTDVKLIVPPISHRIIERKIPKLLWIKYPRSITTPRASIARQLRTLVQKRRLTNDPALSNADLVNANLDELRKEALLSARPTAARKRRSVSYRARSRRIHAYILARADGHCEACNAAAPFLKSDSSPYLEPHHTMRLADEGPDHPATVVALCPNCHRRAHSSLDKVRFNKSLKLKARRLWLR